MKSNDILSYVRAEPFRPFRIVLNSGKSYEVGHPEMVKVLKSSLMFFYRDIPNEPPDRWETVSLALIQNIEHIDVPAQQLGRPPKVKPVNGKPTKKGSVKS